MKKSFGGVVIFGMNELVYWGAQLRPLTGLRHKYDWGNPGSDVGLGEFVIMGGSTVGVHSITANDDYLGYGTTPVRPLDGSSHEIWERVDNIIRQRSVDLFMSTTSVHHYDWKG